MMGLWDEGTSYLTLVLAFWLSWQPEEGDTENAMSVVFCCVLLCCRVNVPSPDCLYHVLFCFRLLVVSHCTAEAKSQDSNEKGEEGGLTDVNHTIFKGSSR